MDKETQSKLNEIIMLLSIFVKRDTQQTTLIRELNSVGFQPKRIAEIVGTTPNTVRVAVHQLKKTKKGGKNGGQK